MAKQKNGKEETPVVKILKDGKEIKTPTERRFVLTFNDSDKGLQSNIDTQGFTNMEQVAMVEIIKMNLIRDHFTPKK